MKGEEKLRALIDQKADSKVITEQLADLLAPAFGDAYAEVGFIAWDLKAVLDAAVAVFEKSGLDWVMFHSFRQEADGIMLFNKKE